MSLEGALKILNTMVRDKIVSEFAVGGAMAAMFYTEPFQTEDLDIFVVFPQPEQAILTLDPIFAYLKSKGSSIKGPYVVVDGVPVRILPIPDALVAEAVEQALTRKVGAQSVQVLRPEHLLAIMTSVGRTKDRLRIPFLLEQTRIDKRLLRGILSRHGLVKKWDKIVKM